MRYNTLNILAAIFLASFGMTACNQSKKSDNNPTDTTMKKTELLKKEDQLIKNAGDTAIQHQENARNDLDFLRAMDGKYPNAVKLLDNPVFTARLKKLLGSRYTFLKETWAVETPIEVKNDIFIASGCEQHNCGSTNFMIVVDLAKNKMYAGIREEEKVSTYSEDETTSMDIQKWAGQQ